MNLKEAIEKLVAESKTYETCMAVLVSKEGHYVELVIDTSRQTYSRTIPGIVGGDCGLICDVETDEVIGIKLRLITDKLMVSHSGPFRLNEGFVKDGSTDANI